MSYLRVEVTSGDDGVPTHVRVMTEDGQWCTFHPARECQKQQAAANSVRVLPIVHYRSTETGFDRLKLGPEGVDYPATLMRANPSDDDLSLINLPADAAPGKFVVELAVHCM
jgi:hypothetical protein